MAKLFFTTLAKAMAVVFLVVAVVNIAFAQETEYVSLNIPGTHECVNMRIYTNKINTLYSHKDIHIKTQKLVLIQMVATIMAL